MNDGKFFRKNNIAKRIISIILMVLITVSIIAIVPSVTAESLNIQEIEVLQQQINDKGYNYTVAENWITQLSPSERKALSGYKPIKAPEEPLPDNVRFILDKPKPIVKFRPFGKALAGIPSSYDAMALGYVTPVKDQMGCGSCWIFAAIADFESDVAIGESSLFDFSEQEVGDCNIWSSVNDFCDGGDAFMTTNYFTKYGSADETCHPYEEAQGTCKQCPILKNVDNWRIITWDDGSESEYIATIKNAILNYGPVFSTVYSSDSGFNSYSGGVYEYWGSEETDHAIEIIGWNDSLPHSKGTGAWLIKNSWGTSWGASGPYPGCAWVAYGAANIGDETSAISSYINPGDTKFYHDEGGWMGNCWGYDSPIAYGAVRFVPSNDSSLQAVDFWAVDTNMNYEIKIFDTLNNLGAGNYNFGDQLGNTQTGTINEEGYYSIPLDTPVSLTSGDDFIIHIKLTTTGWGYPLPIDDNQTIATFSDESYSSYDGLQFEKPSSCDIGIRARTVAQAIITEPVDGACVKGIININGTADDTDFKYYLVEWKNTTVDWTEIHNSTVPVSDGILATWNTDNLEDGSYSIRLTVADYASNLKITLINVTIDNTPPTAILIQPEEGAYIRGTIDINGTANDMNLYNYTIEWKNTTVDWTEIHKSTVPVSDGTLATWNTDNLEDGSYSIRLTVADNASNLNITLINVTIDNTLPTAKLTQPEEGAYIRGTIDINGTANDTNFYNYTIEWKNTTVDWTEIYNSTVPVSDGTLATWNTDNLEDGGYSIRLTVVDNAYNSNVTSVDVTIDNTLPIIYSVSLNDNMVKIGDKISLRVNATDAISNDLIVIVHGINETGVETGNSTLEKIETYLYGIDLIVEEDHPEGNMTLNISVSDEANNIVYNDSLNVTIDMTQPSVTSLSLSTLVPVIGEIVNITVNVDDTYLNSSSVFALINSPTNTYELPMDPSISDEYYCNFNYTDEFGKYTITVSASDQAGNVNNSETTWFITVLPPFVNKSINTTANNVTTVDALEEVNSTLDLFTSNDTTNGSIEITMSNNIPPTLNQSFGIRALGKYVSINVSHNLNANLTWAIIKIYYTQAELEASGLDESTLVLRYYNETSDIWEPVTPSGVIQTDSGIYSGYVWANVSHFSYYGVGGALEIPPPSNGNGNGGGGGGGGGASGEDFYNIVLSETDRQSVYKNSHISYRFDLEGNIVKHINFTALNSAGKVAAKVEILNNTSTLVSTPPPDEVYKNLNIWVGNYGWATEKNMADTTVSFTVEKSWVTDNNIDETTIALYRYSDDVWHKLVTKKIAEGANSLQFEAETSGFSPFVVSGKTGEPRVEGIIAEPTATAEKTPAPTPTEEKGMPGFGLFAGLSVLLIAVQLLRKKE